MSLKEIAKIAGTSPATVSRILNDPNYKCAKEGLRDKVWKAAAALNYVPNEAARNLKKGTKNTEKNYHIYVLMTRSDGYHADPFFSELLRVIESQIHKNMCILSKIWYNSSFSSDRRSAEDVVDKTVKEMQEEIAGKNDGLIIIGRCNKRALKKLKGMFKNIVSVNRNSTNYEVDEVLCDGKKIATLAVEHLVELGHTAIAYVGECRNDARFDGYMETLKKHDLELIPEYISDIRQSEAKGYEIMEEYLKAEEKPTAFYCANDITAVGMLKCLNHYRNRYYVPSIIASDNIEESQFTKPMLTTVNLPKEEMGKFTVDLLLDRIKGGHENIVRFEIEGNLVVRSSCAPAWEANVTEYYI